MSLVDVATQVSRACDKASRCRDALGAAQEAAEDAQAVLSGALAGSGDPEAERAVADFTEVVRGVVDLWRALGAGMDHAQAVLDALLGTGPPPTPPTSRVEPDHSPTIAPDRIEQLRRALPPHRAPGGPHQKTRGQWIGPDGTAQSIVSGRDEYSSAADTALRDRGMPRLSAKTADVEIKLAVRMAAEGIRHATVVINAKPCAGPFGCDTLVPVLLPEGATLTVHGVTPSGEPFRKRYAGGARPWWR
ncbi:DddA-like double-stranded DNA deaminase toxin [Actinosynnema sp. NPDC023658]|uniref:DddA-like double-stranded DNA deaminase toxin n=1 Tax=Actinosynnema sp. NPDC023658 TaxID=3155465 RepID=UPI00340C5F45